VFYIRHLAAVGHAAGQCEQRQENGKSH
jgi:hypothetical protein